MVQQYAAMERQGGNMVQQRSRQESLADEAKRKKNKEEKAKKTKFWRILKKKPGQDVLLTKRKKARQEPLDMNSGGLAKRGYGKARQ